MDQNRAGPHRRRVRDGRIVSRRQYSEAVVAGSAMGESYLDANIVRPEDIEEKSQDYVKFDHEVVAELPHLKGRFRWDLEKYYRDRFGPYLPKG